MGTAAFAILPPATTYERLWKAQRQIVLPPSISCGEFAVMLAKEIQRFDELILRDWMENPFPTYIGGVETRIIKPCDFVD